MFLVTGLELKTHVTTITQLQGKDKKQYIKLYYFLYLYLIPLIHILKNIAILNTKKFINF